MKNLSVQGCVYILKWRICIGFTFYKFQLAGDENGKREEDLEEEIKDVKERFRSAEVNAEIAELDIEIKKKQKKKTCFCK